MFSWTAIHVQEHAPAHYDLSAAVLPSVVVAGRSHSPNY